MTKQIIRYSFLFILPLFWSCEDYLDLPLPTDTYYAEGVFERDITIGSAIDGIAPLITVSNGPDTNVANTMQLIGLYIDELDAQNGVFLETYFNNLIPVNAPNTFLRYYRLLFSVNSIIEGINNSTATLANRDQYLGEMHFYRAWIYMFLTNIYKEVPIITTINPDVIITIEKSTQEQVYQQIRTDLEQASQLLSANYLNRDGRSTTERYRPNKLVVDALMARYFLYNQEWENAEIKATNIINHSNYNLVQTDQTFKIGRNNVIWRLKTTDSGPVTREAFIYLSATVPGNNMFVNTLTTLSIDLKDSFEPTDERRQHWVLDFDNFTDTADTHYYPYKYRLDDPETFSPIYLRIAEQYLIRAEARAMQGNITGGLADLNTLRTMRGLPNANANDQNTLVDAILSERRHELFLEDGHRWFDLRRTGKLDAIMQIRTPLKSNSLFTWETYKQYWPLSSSELQRSPRLKQTDGY